MEGSKPPGKDQSDDAEEKAKNQVTSQKNHSANATHRNPQPTHGASSSSAEVENSQHFSGALSVKPSEARAHNLTTTTISPSASFANNSLCSSPTYMPLALAAGSLSSGANSLTDFEKQVTSKLYFFYWLLDIFKAFMHRAVFLWILNTWIVLINLIYI